LTELIPLSAIDAAAVEALLDEAFGADRHGRTAYAVRAGVESLAALSFAAVAEGALVGTLQSWPVALAFEQANRRSLVMVGPVAVSPDAQGKGIGQMLTRACCRALDEAGLSAVMIGDPGFYQRFFGFVSGPASRWTLPGPVEPERILLRAGEAVRWPAHGALGPDVLRSRA